MSRRWLSIACEGAQLAATLDEAPEAGGGTSGLLIVSGGNEIRAGAWNGQAQLAARLAAAGHPVLRFDRRGVGDSDGPNGGYRSSAADIAAALAAFHAAQPQLCRVTAFGNCDAASALMLAGGAGADALALANPWTFADADAALPARAIRAHYRQRLASGAALKRLLTGKVSLRDLLAALRRGGAAAVPNPLAEDMAIGLSRFTGPVALLIAARDRTGQCFLADWPRNDARLQICESASHSFVEPEARAWLEARLLEVLAD